MFFQIVVNLIRTVSCVNFVHVAICTLRFHMYLCLLLLSRPLFMCYFVPPYEIGEGIVSLCLCQFIHPSVYLFDL